MRIIKIILVTILVIIVSMNCILVFKTLFYPKEVPSIFGYKPFIVLSGSMHPTFDYGDLIITKETKFADLKIGDVISFRNSDDSITTHRIIREENGCFVTQGDNNNKEDDGIICSKHLEGKYLNRIIGLGNVLLFIKEPLGFCLLMAILIIICIYLYLWEPKLKQRRKKEE